MKVFEKIAFLIGRGFLLAVTGFFIGMLVAMGGYYLHNAGYFSSWESSGSVPAGTVELVTIQGGQIYIRIENGDIYQRPESESEANWVKSVLPETESHSGYMKWDEVHPCRREWPAFAFFNGTPWHIVDCLQVDVAHFEGFWKTVYAFDKNNRLWIWAVGDSGFMGAAFMGIGMMGAAITGLFFGWSWEIFKWLRSCFPCKNRAFISWWVRLPKFLRLAIVGAVLGWGTSKALLFIMFPVHGISFGRFVTFTMMSVGVFLASECSLSDSKFWGE